jgi:hypothetical protein
VSVSRFEVVSVRAPDGWTAPDPSGVSFAKPARRNLVYLRSNETVDAPELSVTVRVAEQPDSLQTFTVLLPPARASVSERVEPADDLRQRVAFRSSCGHLTPRLALRGDHQRINAATAISIVELLPARGWPIGADAILHVRELQTGLHGTDPRRPDVIVLLGVGARVHRLAAEEGDGLDMSAIRLSAGVGVELP